MTIHIHLMFPVVSDSCCSVDTLNRWIREKGEENVKGEEEEIRKERVFRGIRPVK